MSALGPLEEAPAYLIYRLSRLLRQSLKKALDAGGLDVTSEQYFLLYRLFQKDGLAQSQLADSVIGDYPNITRHIDSLEKKDLVVRMQDETDRRKYLINLTTKGREHMERAVPIIQEQRSMLFGDFDDEMIDNFRSMITQIQSRLI